MRLVQLRDGALEIRWTWLPYWLAVNPKLKTLVEREMRDAALLGGVTTSEADLDGLHDFVLRRLSALFPAFPGLREHLDGLRLVKEPGEA
jgi:hypothetical protein